jgi:F-type H+-transporting ATPase subunit b
MVAVSGAPVVLAATNNFLLPNGTFIAELVAFLVLLWLLARYVWPPLQRAMAERQATIERQLNEGQEARERLAAAEREYRELIDSTRADANRIREEARAEGQRIVEEFRERAQTEADRIRTRGEEQLAAQRDQVVTQLRGEMGRLAVELAERIVGESLTDDDRQRRVIDRFLGELERQPSAQETR